MGTAAFWDTTWSRSDERYNRHHQDIWAAVQPLIRGRVCDLGCGPATMYRPLHEAGKLWLTGVDFSKAALRRARRTVPNGQFVLADVRATGLPDATFDSVLMFGLLDYFEDWEPVLAEARRIAKHDAPLVATLLNGFQGHDWTGYPHLTGNWHLYTENGIME